MRDRIVQFGLLLLAFAFFFYGLRSHSQSWYFQDENDHVAVGWVLAEFDQRLYEDVITNHQPIPVIVGGALAQSIPFNTLFQLIDRLRMAMLLFYFLAGVCGVWRFRWTGLIASTMLASLTYAYFGWYVLAESLVSPVVMLLFLYMFAKAKGETITNFDAVLVGVALFWLTFCLLPLWPLVAMVAVWWLWQLDWPRRRLMMAAGIIPTAILFWFISPLAWLEQAVLNNIYYVIGEASPQSLLTLTWYPMAHWLTPHSFLGRFYILSSALIIASLTTKHRLKIQGLVLLLWLLNTRTDQVDATFYQGFHLLPYLAGVATVVAISAGSLWQWIQSKWQRCLVAIVIGLLLVSNSNWVLERKDRLSEAGIQYGTQQAIANGLNTIRMPGDTLTTGPDGSGYINLLTSLPFGTKQNFHLNWSWRSRQLREAFIADIKANPPVFYYFQADPSSDYYAYLQPILTQDYHRFSRPDGSVTDLYIKKSEIDRRSDSQWGEFLRHYFNPPDEML